MNLRAALTSAAFAAVLVAGLAGCAAPASTPAPTTAPPTEDVIETTDAVGTWLDEGRSIALVTWGSSSAACTPMVADVTASGSTLTVEFAEPAANAICTADFTPRATFVPVVEGLDTAQGVTLAFSGGNTHGEVELPARATSATGPSEGTPSANWFEGGGVVLLTWGSSSCPPVVEGIEEGEASATVTFVTDASKMCTMDFAPRLTILDVAMPAATDGYVLNLVGGQLDGTVTVGS